MREFDAVLDTSAIVCVLEDEPGADVVEEQLAAARAEKSRRGASCVSLVEVYYKAARHALDLNNQIMAD